MKAVVLAVLLACGACGESVSEHIEAHRATAKAKLAKVDEVRRRLLKEKPNAWATMKDPGPLAICDLLIAPYREAGCNTWVIGLEQLMTPRRFLDPAPPVVFGQADWLVMSTTLLDSGRFPPNASYPEGDVADRLTRPIIYAISWLEQVRFVIVVRTDTLERPLLAEDQKSYTPGSFTGEAILYALEPEVRSLGGAPFSYSMVGDVKVRMRQGVIQLAQIEKAFADGVRLALIEALLERIKALERP